VLQGIRFVLVRPARGGNVGAAARALKNMGFRELWLVAPRDLDQAEARWMAHGAQDVLDAARSVATLAEALADCRWCVGTTRRHGRRRMATRTPRELALEARAQAERRPLAVVFGPEEDGLAAQELALCQDVVRIPADVAQPSLNLAQAVLVIAYELQTASLGRDAESAPGCAGDAAPTTLELEGLYEHLGKMLLEVGFARRDTLPAKLLALRNLLGRARPTPGDVQLLRGICRQVLWAVRRDATRRRRV
jgi:tRNA (cytidine32/uridine32-2'-O)-methyltransferase